MFDKKLHYRSNSQRAVVPFSPQELKFLKRKKNIKNLLLVCVLFSFICVPAATYHIYNEIKKSSKESTSYAQTISGLDTTITNELNSLNDKGVYKDTKEKLNSLIAALKNKNENKWEKEKSKLLGANKDLSKSLSTRNAEYDSLKKKHSTLEAECNSLKKIEAEYDSLNEKHSKLEEKYNSLKKKHKVLEYNNPRSGNIEKDTTTHPTDHPSQPKTEREHYKLSDHARKIKILNARRRDWWEWLIKYVCLWSENENNKVVNTEKQIFFEVDDNNKITKLYYLRDGKRDFVKFYVHRNYIKDNTVNTNKDPLQVRFHPDDQSKYIFIKLEKGTKVKPVVQGMPHYDKKCPDKWMQIELPGGDISFEYSK